MTVIIQNSNRDLQPCSEMCASLQSSVYNKVPWGSQKLRIFYTKELFLSYNVCCIICERNTLFVQFYNLKLIWQVFLHYIFLHHLGHRKVNHICTGDSLPNWSGSVVFPYSIVSQNPNLSVLLLNFPVFLLKVAQTGNRWQQWVPDPLGPKASIQWSNLSITNKNKLKAALTDAGNQKGKIW